MYDYIMWLTPFLVFFACALGLFIRDGNKAKEEGRKRKIGITVLLIISAGLLALFIILSVLLLLLTIAIVQNM